MNAGVWVWPESQRAQRNVLSRLSDSPSLVAALKAIAKSKDGLSNSELDDMIGDNSEWLTLWAIRQLTSLGFIEFKVAYFGEAARYQLTGLGRGALSLISGQPAPAAPSAAVKAA